MQKIKVVGGLVADARSKVGMNSVAGPILLLDISLEAIRELIRSTGQADDLPICIAGKFANPSRYLDELSNELNAIEKRRSILWAPFQH